MGRLPETAQSPGLGGAGIAEAAQREFDAVDDQIVAVLDRGVDSRQAQVLLAIAHLDCADAPRARGGDAACARLTHIPIGSHIVGADREAVLLPLKAGTRAEVLVGGCRRTTEGEHVQHGFSRVDARPNRQHVLLADASVDAEREIAGRELIKKVLLPISPSGMPMSIATTSWSMLTST